jgi:hypothetical protein
MSFNDIANGTFEMLGGLFILFSIMKLHGDKQVKGVSYIYLTFFTIWGYWNLYYYPSLGQWWSFVGGVSVVAMNTVWLGQILYYTRKAKQWTL